MLKTAINIPSNTEKTPKLLKNAGNVKECLKGLKLLNWIFIQYDIEYSFRDLHLILNIHIAIPAV